MGVVRLESPVEVDSLVDPAGLVGAVRRVLASSESRAPLRAHLEYRGTWFAAMPAAGLGRLVVKAVGVFPRNPSRGFPLVRGVLMLFDAETGELLLEAEASSATGWRTAAATALAAGLLGYRGGGTLSVIGAGVQASYHLRVLTSLYRPDRVLVASRTAARAERLAREYGGEAAPVDRAVSEGDLVVAATTAREPVVRGSTLKPGAVVASVGAPKPVVELDRAAIERAGCVLVDTRDGYLAEAGEAEEHPSGVPIVELAEALRHPGACRHGDVAVYKSVGTALLDLAVAIHLHERARGGATRP